MKIDLMLYFFFVIGVFFGRDSGQVTLLDSKKMILYTWDHPRGVRKLFWKPYMGIDKPTEIPVDKVKKCEDIYLLILFSVYGNRATLIRYVFL